MQIFLNILLYGFLAYWLYESVIAKDWWYCFRSLVCGHRVRRRDSAARLSCVKGVTWRVPV